MDLIPVIDHQEYLVFDDNFTVVQFSGGIQKYAEQKIYTGEDLRRGFPELVGLESVCQEIATGETTNFSLESIARTPTPEEIIYFNLHIQAFQEHLVMLLEEVTELLSLRQSSMQRLNEAEIALNKLQRFEYCTNKIIASMRDVLIITTPSGLIERVNRSATDLLGQKKSALLNQSINDVIEATNFNHQEIYDFLRFSQEPLTKIEVSFSNQQNREIQIEFDCFLAPTEIQDFFNCVYIGRDITARKTAEAEIRKSLAREKELRQLKSGFISMASHEFRNPLSSILLCVQNLSVENNLKDAERQFYLQSIRDAALNMNSLLEDVLIISRAESGKQNLNLLPLDLEKFCLQIIQELTAIYPQKQIDFTYYLNQKLVNLDQATLRHILNNLLSNALKYSPQGATVDLKIFSAQENFLQEIVIEVCDRGIGIPLKSQKHLFESFYRASNVGNTPGTGLGLSIVNKAVELYQGKIAIDSKLNQGTKITVTLPVFKGK